MNNKYKKLSNFTFYNNNATMRPSKVFKTNKNYSYKFNTNSEYSYYGPNKVAKQTNNIKSRTHKLNTSENYRDSLTPFYSKYSIDKDNYNDDDILAYHQNDKKYKRGNSKTRRIILNYSYNKMNWYITHYQLTPQFNFTNK